jgi:hypothetical protein
MIIKFGDYADTTTMGAILEGLAGWTINVKYVQPNMEGFPELCSIDETNRDGVVICDVNDIGKPIANSRYHVDFDRIESITII